MNGETMRSRSHLSDMCDPVNSSAFGIISAVDAESLVRQAMLRIVCVDFYQGAETHGGKLD